MASISSSELKFRRARKHLGELEEAVKAYHQSEPFEIYIDAKPDSGPAIYRVRIKTPTPPELALMVGDTVHNARSALDHVACELVEAGGGSRDNAAFPTGTTEQKFREALRNGMRKAPPAAKDAVRALRVFPGGDGKLWSLHRLDIDDKHKLLIPVASSHQTVNLHIGWGEIQLDPLGLRPKDPAFPLTDGCALLTISEQPRFAEDPSGFRQDYSFNFDLALPPESLASPRPTPVISGLTDLVAHAETVAQQLLATVN